jgi:hypothetical protein
LGRSSRSTGSSRRRSAWTWGSASHLGLVLATRWAARTAFNQSSRWRSYGGWSHFVLASTRAAPTSRRHWRAKVQTRTICVSHADKEEC